MGAKFDAGAPARWAKNPLDRSRRDAQHGTSDSRPGPATSIWESVLRDEVNEPLGTRPTPTPLATRAWPWMRRLYWVVVTIGLSGLGFMAWRGWPDPRGPVAIVPIEEVTPEPTPLALAVAAPALPLVNAAPADPDSFGSVRVVRNGSAGASMPGGPQIINVAQALGGRLAPAPDKRLVEPSRFGPLPKIGADGARPSRVYARPPIASALGRNAPRIAILVDGVGLDAEGTRAAISDLPPAVSLGVAPYGAEVARDATRARDAGHEIWLQAPMEAVGGVAPGPHTLATGLSDAENRSSLEWQMGRFPGFVGVTNYLGGKLTADPHAFTPVLTEIGARGLEYFDDGSSPLSRAAEIASTLDLDMGRADVMIDAAPTADAIAAALERLEDIARHQGAAIGVASGLPIGVERVARWAVGLEGRGIALVPLSALVGRKPSSSARANP